MNQEESNSRWPEMSLRSKAENEAGWQVFVPCAACVPIIFLKCIFAQSHWLARLPFCHCLLSAPTATPWHSVHGCPVYYYYYPSLPAASHSSASRLCLVRATNPLKLEILVGISIWSLRFASSQTGSQSGFQHCASFSPACGSGVHSLHVISYLLCPPFWLFWHRVDGTPLTSVLLKMVQVSSELQISTGVSCFSSFM